MGILDKIKKSKPQATDEKQKDAVVKSDDKKEVEKDVVAKDKKVDTDKSGEKKGLLGKLKKDTKDDSAKVSSKKLTAAQVQAIKILLQPIVTEKSTMTGTYTFKVKYDTSRNEVKKAFSAMYGKTPRKVNVMNVRGKKVTFGRIEGKRANWKKAVVYLKKGETVDIFVD
ncbi:MAG: 50S ribosomal protein L23 [bacterium]|nr:50S ribosomal protein L23 [bacterium]